MKRLTLHFFFLFIPLFIIGQSSQAISFSDLLKKKRIDVISIQPIEPKHHFKQAFKIKIRQPLDHQNPDAGFFEQLIYLKHFDFHAPTVLVTEGYNAINRSYEISSLLKANQIEVEYRFNGESRPDSIQWQYLTNKQGADDLHRIRKLFGKIYRKKWLSTGISKGGSTTLIYKFEYPRDVKVWIPYVAPLATAQEDTRINDFIANLGDEKCQRKIEVFQKMILQRRNSILPYIDKLAVSKGLEFSRGIDVVLEFAVLEFPFSFWQYGHDCREIPDNNASNHQLYEYLDKIVGLDFYSDKSYEKYKPAFYQFLTELGYYGYRYDHLEDLLISLEKPTNLPFGPGDVDLSYDGEYVQNVMKWLDRKGKRIIYIYGGVDPWTAAGITPNPKTGSLHLVKPDGGHTTRIRDLSTAQQNEIYAALRKWLKVPVYKLQ